MSLQRSHGDHGLPSGEPAGETSEGLTDEEVAEILEGTERDSASEPEDEMRERYNDVDVCNSDANFEGSTVKLVAALGAPQAINDSEGINEELRIRIH